MPTGYMFDKPSTKRLAAVLRAYEREPQRVINRSRSQPGAPSRPIVRGKLDGSLSQGGSATLSIWYYNGSAEADSGEDLTVYDGLLKSGSSIASGKKVIAMLDQASGRYYVTSAECP